MAMSMYQASIPQLTKMLSNLSNILKKGEEFAKAKNIDGTVLVGSRLAVDMFPLAKQVQIACDQVKNGMARLAGVEPLKFDDNETTFAQLQERIAKTIAFANGIQPAQVDGTEAKEIKFSIKEWNFEFVGEQYLLTWIIPNFYFHVTTAYNILRHNGVEIGKSDFLGG
ncbi:hypothetical protein A8O14_03655 [Polynucleobacter wuianus]|uniref:DUF1993 domain-containing protein n=1 Tax=Polynucleobacter wuianus TaxID=1743168 RepID=A0A191UEF0_9BURK|nr:MULTISPECIES: DUF1993 domain-containing protein [Polynucleobacter]ANI99271.1 hypothetical protein A8O14_03655 [Polynucleobacter wuianus]MBU3552139.1 DUF1993 domain-containing protein [Polynucleobacter sp. MWH-Post4-6-1]MBU3609574.1 DUF1993 domain-containing protein [Polynucleobacter wuianus]